MVVRIVPAVPTEPAEIAALIRRIERETPSRHVIVELLSQTGEVDRALEDVRAILAGARAGVGA